MRTIRTVALCSLSLVVSMSAAAPAWSQERVGVATAVVGPVTVARTSLPPEPLRFKDAVFLHDRVTTGDNAITRILLGGKIIVTARERSTLTITEMPGLSVIDLSSGRIAVAVDRSRMKQGERVDIRTPNAIAGVRGTVLVVEAEPNVSTVTVLRGLVEVTRRAVGSVTPVAKLQTITIRNDVLPAKAQAITPARAEALSREFTPPMRPVAAAAVMPVEEEMERATALLKALLPAETEAGDRQGATASGSINAEAEGTPTPMLSSTPIVNATPTLTSGSTGPITSTLGSAVSTTTSLMTNTVSTTTSLLTSTVSTTTSLVTTTLAPATSLVTTTLAPTTSLLPTTPLVPTAPLAPPPPSSSGSLLGGLLTPVSGLVK